MAFSIAVLMNHLSSMAQTLILSVPENSDIAAGRCYTTGSSMMPQKRNRTRWKWSSEDWAGSGILMGLPFHREIAFLSYNRDTQWTKYSIMDLVDECAPLRRSWKRLLTLCGLTRRRWLPSAKRIHSRFRTFLSESFRGNISSDRVKERSRESSEILRGGRLERISSLLSPGFKEEGLKVKTEEKIVRSCPGNQTNRTLPRNATGTPEAPEKKYPVPEPIPENNFCQDG